jgi:ABC-type Co2+ transport system permease subunit
MKKRLTNVNPLKLGITLAVIYGVISLIIVPFFLLAALFGARGGIIGVGFAIIFPIIYAAAGFIAGIVTAFVYNLVAKWTGGVEFTTEEVQ